MMEFNWWMFAAGRIPALVVWAVFVAGGILFQRRCPGAPAILVILGAAVALVASVLSLGAEASMHLEMRSPDYDPGVSMRARAGLMSMIHLFYLAGALTCSVSLLFAISGIPRPAGR